jgi:hypothetical protein
MSFNNKTDKQALNEWEEFLEQIRNSTPIDVTETTEQKSKRIKDLEKDPEKWFEYYFPKYAFAKPAPFQIASTKRIMKANKLYQRRAWARGLAKSTRRMMEVFYLSFAKQFPTNCLLISKSQDNAIRLLAPYKGNLEANQRLINDYGTQEKIGSWTDGEFATRSKKAFRAVGRGQNPRGSKNEEKRVNMIIFDDVDDDEVCRNSERLQEAWEWCEQTAIPTVDISLPYYIFFDNNIIAEDSIAVRAAEYADDVELVNIRDENNKSVWSKNSEDDIDYMLSIISYESAQKEYFNNPLGSGHSFDNPTFGKCPPLNKLPFVVMYADPATSNSDKPRGKKNKAQNSCKAVGLVGYYEMKYFIYKAFVDNTGNSTFIDWMYFMRDFVGEKTQLFSFIENNTLQNPFYEQVLLPLISEKGKQHPRGVLPVTPDGRDKPEKWTRIEGNLEPLWRLGCIVCNEDEKEDPHMKRMIAQFKAASATCKTMDAPDCIEGAVHIIKTKNMIEAVHGVQVIKKPKNPKKF